MTGSSTPKRIRTLLIEDSAFMRIYVSDMLRSDKAIELVGTAPNGREGVEKAKMLHPDVVITDMVMPGYNGLYVVKTLMKQMPVPIILMSSLDKSDQQIFDALSEGAFHFCDKPNGNTGKNEVTTSVLIKLIKEAAARTTEMKPLITRRNNLAHSFDSTLYDIIAIGASTGGPGALEFIINNLPENLITPVVIAQHMPHHFIETFAARLNVATQLTIKVAKEGEEIKHRTVYLLPGTGNFQISRDTRTGLPYFQFTDAEYPEYNAPSVDCLFHSVANTFENRAIGILLTGMGKDGAQGLLKMKQKKSFTIVQDQQTSVVFGMPQAAINAGAACQVLPLQQIPGFVISCL